MLPITHCVAKGDLVPGIVLPPPLGSWDYSYEPSCLAYEVLKGFTLATQILRQLSCNPALAFSVVIIVCW